MLPRARMSQQAGFAVWLETVINNALKPRRTTDGQRLLVLTATPAALVFGLLLMRHVSRHGSVFSAAPSAFTDAGA